MAEQSAPTDPRFQAPMAQTQAQAQAATSSEIADVMSTLSNPDPYVLEIRNSQAGGVLPFRKGFSAKYH